MKFIVNRSKKMQNVVVEKSLEFAIRVVKLFQFLEREKKEFVLSKQLLRSGTSIGANIREAIQGFSKKDFTAKMSVALKEASETEYWLEILYKTDYLSVKEYESIMADCAELNKILISIVKQSRESGQGK